MVYSISPMDGQRILITGGLGFFGSSLAISLVKLGAKVTSYDALLPQYGGNLASIAEISDKIEDVRGDVRDSEMLSKYIRDKDVVFNCAAQVSHVDSMTDPYLDVEINCRGNLNVLEAVRKYNDSAKIVYVGTRSQVGVMRKNPIDENHPEFPRDIYSANKAVAEKYHLIYTAAYGIYTTSMRVTNAYGPRAQMRNPSYGVVNRFIKLALNDEIIPVYEPGTQTRDLVFINDSIDALILGAQDQRANGEVFFVGSGEKTTLIDIAKVVISKARSGKLALVPWPEERKQVEVGDVSVTPQKIGEILGWHPKTNLDYGMEKTVEFYRAHLSEYI